MKVALHVGQLFQPVPGGTARYVEGLVDTLPDAGVDLVTFAASPGPATPTRALPNYVNLGWPHAPWRYELWHRLRWPALHVEADVIHAPTLAVPPPGGVPLVVTVHDVAFLRHPEAFTRRGVAFHRRGLAIAHREAAAILTISEFTRRELLQAGFDPGRLHLAPIGVEVPEASPDAVLDAKVAAAGVNGSYVLTVGTIEPRKGLDTLASAMAVVRRTHPQLDLVIVGPAGWLSVKGLEGPGIQRLGHVDEATLDALYRRAMVCAVPSRYEGFGLPALEAMARGCPVVASDATALPEVVGDAGRLVPVDDVACWAKTLNSLLADDAARADFAARGRRRASTFTRAASVQAHLDAYAAAGARAAHS